MYAYSIQDYKENIVHPILIILTDKNKGEYGH